MPSRGSGGTRPARDDAGQPGTARRCPPTRPPGIRKVLIAALAASVAPTARAARHASVGPPSPLEPFPLQAPEQMAYRYRAAQGSRDLPPLEIMNAIFRDGRIDRYAFQRAMTEVSPTGLAQAMNQASWCGGHASDPARSFMLCFDRYSDVRNAGEDEAAAINLAQLAFVQAFGRYLDAAARPFPPPVFMAAWADDVRLRPGEGLTVRGNERRGIHSAVFLGEGTPAEYLFPTVVHELLHSVTHPAWDAMCSMLPSVAGQERFFITEAVTEFLATHAITHHPGDSRLEVESHSNEFGMMLVKHLAGTDDTSRPGMAVDAGMAVLKAAYLGGDAGALDAVRQAATQATAAFGQRPAPDQSGSIDGHAAGPRATGRTAGVAAVALMVALLGWKRLHAAAGPGQDAAHAGDPAARDALRAVMNLFPGEEGSGAPDDFLRRFPRDVRFGLLDADLAAAAAAAPAADRSTARGAKPPILTRAELDAELARASRAGAA